MGMVETFHAVSVSGAETTSRVASGISKALITTQFGLSVAIPGVFGLARVRRLVHHVRAQFSMIRVETLPILERAGSCLQRDPALHQPNNPTTGTAAEGRIRGRP
jgi:biopolymer transport protein ExbB/TolQ